ncbi:50S ribosomal protein L31 [Candidatus Gottesmanbacteria bacterium RBG_16_43_7]|uniref:Large ribosomal subunit protein bL31 n=1 Tax=Candidatus Gottesmanbacteria bacterium RBG_16_43_7 TaxID=1798373 RepID=A0A1F5Z8D5_9BACT|nr:MAG: 50S ribosomal protein L31 [Candidatus Gottesmanbacteria bacterium RBG_16_43_7]
MKTTIHPKWYNDTLVRCACGNTYKIGATKAEISVDICSKCHPFFTGEMRFVDTLGRVDKFKKKQETAKVQAAKITEKKKKKEEQQKQLRNQKSLKEMLSTLR